MARLRWQDFERRAGEFFARDLGIRLFSQWPVHLKNGLTHRFDFSSEDQSLVIQCKSLTWTKSGNYPSGKVVEAQRAIHMLQESNAVRKIIVFDDHINQKEQSFVEVFVRRNKDSLSGIEVWKYFDEKFELYYGSIPKFDPADARAVELATNLLGDLSHRETTERIVSFREIAERVGITTEILHRIADAIEVGLKSQGIPVMRERDTFRLVLQM